MIRTKIVATIGPASREPAVLEALIKAGLSVARLNFSHGTHGEHAEVVADVRRISEKLDRPVAVLQDLSGPKIRTGPMAATDVELVTGETFILTSHIMSEIEELADNIAFLLEGKVRFQGPAEQIKEETGHSKLERAIAHMMQTGEVACWRSRSESGWRFSRLGYSY